VLGYPFWLSLTQGSAWDDSVQKQRHAHYLRNAVQIEKGDLLEIQELIKKSENCYLFRYHRATK